MVQGHLPQKIQNKPHSGDVWFVLDANHVRRACIAAHDIDMEKLILGS